MSATHTKRCPTCSAMMLPDARFCVECGQPLPDASPGSYSKQLAPPSRTGSKKPKSRGSTQEIQFFTGEDPAPASMSEALASVTGSVNRAAEPSAFGTATVKTDDAPKPSPSPKGRSAPPPPSARNPRVAPASSRPKAPAFGQPEPAASQPPTNEELEMDWADLEQGFDAILSDSGAPQAHSVPSAADAAAVEELFKQIAVTQLGPVRDFMVELDQGTPTKEWLSVCLPAVATLRASAEKMGVTTVTAALDGLHDTLDAAQKSDGSTIGAEARSAIVQAYDALARELPDVYEASVERDRREPVIVQSLLRQVPGVREVALGKLYAAGLNSLDVFLKARPAEIQETTGLPLALCQEICARFESYQNKHDSVPPSAKRPKELDQLETLKRELNAANDAFARGKTGWSPQAASDRRNARKQRIETLLRINLVLARLGEVDLVNELERVPFERKVAAIDAFLEAAKAAQKP